MLTAPTASINIVPTKIKAIILPIRLSVRALNKSCIATDSRKLNACPKSRANTAPNITIPKPPSCISDRIINLPIKLKSSPVFFTIRPVTQVALVAVNKASTKLRFLASGADAFGSISKPAPEIIKTRKLTISVRVGLLPAAARFTLVLQSLVTTWRTR